MAGRDPELDAAIATLARGLRGAVETGRLFGLDYLPRPPLAARAPGAQLSSPAAPLPVQSPAQAPNPPRPASAALPARALPIVEPSSGPAATHAAIAAVLAEPASAAYKLARLERDVVGACTRCKLHRGRNKLVFGVGNPEAELAFVGEGPGADEDRQGVPFVGKAGQLLTDMIKAMGYRRDDVYICNVVKCRPPNNRDPEPDEVAACEGFLKAQLAVIKPRVIVCLGRHAAQTLLRTKAPISKLRGTWFTYEGIEVMPTYHPSYLLREDADPAKARKREAWSDLKQVMTKLSSR